MDRFPAKVADTLRRIRRKHRHASISVMRNGFYVIESVSRFSEETGRRKTVSLYLGRIERDGRFIEAMHRKARNDVDSVYDLTGKTQEIDATDRALLTILGTNARTSIVEIGRELGMSAKGISYRIAKLERRYGLTYTAEIATQAFGFSRFAITVSFKGPMPGASAIKEVVVNDPRVLLAFLTKGEYELMFIVIAEDTVKLEAWLYKVRSNSVFSGYPSTWNVSHLVQEEGYIPLRKEFFPMLEGKVWHRSKESPSKLPGQLLEREYLVLKELASNGSEEFSIIDRRYGFGRGAALYTYNRLRERGIIRRITTLMRDPPVKYIAIFHIDQRDMRRFMADREKLIRTVTSDSGRPLDRYVWMCGFGAPYGIIMFAPVYKDADMARIEEELGVGGVSIRSLVIASTVVGSLGFRKFDMASTNLYKGLEKDARP